MNAQETGLRIQQLRKDRGWTQKELAQQLSVTDKSVSKWERGLNYPDMAMLEPLAQVLGTTVVELLGIENSAEQEKLEAVTEVAVEETDRLRRELRDRALTILISGIVWLVSQFALGWILHDLGIYGLAQVLTLGLTAFSGTLIGNALWIWWKYRK